LPIEGDAANSSISPSLPLSLSPSLSPSLAGASRYEALDCKRQVELEKFAAHRFLGRIARKNGGLSLQLLQEQLSTR
jgi:hypothetical protein